MRTLRAVLHLALADFRERTRRYAYLLTLASAVWLGWGVNTGNVVLHLGPYRGVLGSGWVGVQMALATSAFVSLVGFYVVKDSVARDRETGVGQIVAATPIGKATYLGGKLLSNFLVLGSTVLVLAVAAAAMQLLSPEARPLEPWPLLSPFLLIALPSMAAVSAFALFFECVPILAGGIGNVLWFFVWGIWLAVAGFTRRPALDFVGFTAVQESLVPFLKKLHPDFAGGMGLEAGPKRAFDAAHTFDWTGMDWTGPMLGYRLLWFVIPVGIVMCASLLFDRFDAARAGSREGGDEDERDERAPVRGTAGATAAAGLTPVPRDARGSRFGALVLAELRLLLKGLKWWWWAVFAGLLCAQAAAPLDGARHHALAAAWIWPILLWSSMGTREARFGTSPLLFSSPRSLTRQLPALLAAGVVVALAAGSVVGARLLLAGDVRGTAAWGAGALFVPSLALALGTASGTSKLFEGFYTVLWYVGPMQGAPAKGLDFVGALPQNAAAPAWVGVAAILVLVSFGARAARMRA